MDDEIAPIILFDIERGGLQEVSLTEDLTKLQQESEKALNLALGTVRLMAGRLSKTIRELERDVMPDEAEIEFSVKLELESGSLVSTVTKVSGGGQLNVKFKWTIDRPDEPTVLISGAANKP